MNIVERLDKLRLKRGLTWDELGVELDLSRSMLHYIRKGERQLSARSFHRLCEAERSAGIEIPSEFQKLVASKSEEIATAGIKVEFLHDAPAVAPAILLSEALAEVADLKEKIVLLEHKLKKIQL